MPDLILIPTELERRFLRRWMDGFDRRGDCIDVSKSTAELELCGFGLVAAAARTVQLIAERRPTRVILVGIAGALAAEAEVGSAIEFASVAVDGIGVGDGESFANAASMGWPHWQTPDSSLSIGDRIDLREGGGAVLLSVCAASADAKHAARRRHVYHDAIAEDMEGFGVAMACKLMNVPLRIVRGISNIAGNRELKTWQIDSSLEQAAGLVHSLLKESTNGETA